MNVPTRIGLDFDNTIAGYNGVSLNAAKEAGLLPIEFTGRKNDVRNAIHESPDGNIAWQRLQGLAYGKLISQATMNDGVGEFLLRCRDKGIPVSIISHKTEFGHFDPDRISLHDAAREWLTAHQFFDSERFALAVEDVHFETTRAEKIDRISETGCSHFVDDLEDVFRDPYFPGEVDAYLYAGAGDEVPKGPFTVCRDWQEIANAILD